MKNQSISISKLLFIFLLLLGTACSPNQSQDAQKEEKKEVSLEDEVMAVHDEAMAKMDAMHSLEVDIKTYLSSLDSTSAKEKITIGTERVTALANASEAMMQWMRNYEPPSKETPEEEVEKYLNDQKISIENVALQINESLKKGKAFLEGKE